MKIAVCIKQVLDPEMPSSAFKIDEQSRHAVAPPGIPPVLSPYDENALEAALRIKDTCGATVVALSLGYKLSRAVLNKTLAAGADDLLMLDDPAFSELDGFATASVLASAIRRLGPVHLVLTGRQAADTNAGIVGPALAEELGIPCVTVASKLDISDGKAIIEREAAYFRERVAAPLPCLVTIDSELGDLRQVTLQGLTQARKKQVQAWGLPQIAIDLLPPARSELLRLYAAECEHQCQILSGSPEQVVADLIERLRRASLLKTGGAGNGR